MRKQKASASASEGRVRANADANCALARESRALYGKRASLGPAD